MTQYLGDFLFDQIDVLLKIVLVKYLLKNIISKGRVHSKKKKGENFLNLGSDPPPLKVEKVKN